MRIRPAISGVHRPQSKPRSRDRGYPSAYSSEWGLKLEILSSILRPADPLFMMRSRTWTKINTVRARRSEKGCLKTGGAGVAPWPDATYHRGPAAPSALDATGRYEVSRCSARIARSRSPGIWNQTPSRGPLVASEVDNGTEGRVGYSIVPNHRSNGPARRTRDLRPPARTGDRAGLPDDRGPTALHSHGASWAW